VNQTITKDNTSTKVVSTLNPSTKGAEVTFKAYVRPATSEVGTPTGKVKFKDGDTVLKEGDVAPYLGSFGAQATFATSDLTVGDHSVKAEYGGDGKFNASTSDALTQKVNKEKTKTEMGSLTNPSVKGQPVTLTASVTSLGAGTPAGTVTFNDGGTALGTATL